MCRFTKKYKNVDFQLDLPIYCILGKVKIFLKKDSITFKCLLNPYFIQTIIKNNEPIWKKQCYRQTDRRIERQMDRLS